MSSVCVDRADISVDRSIGKGLGNCDVFTTVISLLKTYGEYDDTEEKDQVDRHIE